MSAGAFDVALHGAPGVYVETPGAGPPPFRYRHEIWSAPSDLGTLCPCLSGYTADVCYFLDGFSPLGLDMVVRVPSVVGATRCFTMMRVSLLFMAMYSVLVFLGLFFSGLVGAVVHVLTFAMILIQIVFYRWHGGLSRRLLVRLHRGPTTQGPLLRLWSLRSCCERSSFAPYALRIKDIEGPVIAMAKQADLAAAEQALARWTQVLLLRGGAP